MLFVIFKLDPGTRPGWQEVFPFSYSTPCALPYRRLFPSSAFSLAKRAWHSP